MRNATHHRSGLTLIELMVVLLLLIILASVTLPSFSGLKGNTDQKAATDMLRGRIADARGLAMEESAPYRLAVNKDGNKLRLAPDTADFARVPASEDATIASKVIETKIEKATIQVAADPESGVQPAPDQDGWITLGTFLSNGTCREDSTLIEVHEVPFPPMRVLLRGVTGTARMVLPDSGRTGV